MDAAAQGSSSPQMAQPDDDMENENVLMKHVSFFDTNNDGIVYPWETFQGFRSIGCGLMLSAVSALFINIALSRKTIPVRWVAIFSIAYSVLPWMYEIIVLKHINGKKSSILFPIYIENINKCKHGSDSGVYDSEGRFVPAKFEEIFSKHAVTHHDALTGKELNNMLKANREAKDYRGWVASWTEWEILYYLCKDKHKLLRKETVRAVYDGTLFHQMANKKRSSTGDNKRN